MQSIFENIEDELSQNLSDNTSNHSNNSSMHDYSFLPIDGDSHSRSPAIPLPKTHIRRTESENNLTENMRLAEFRDQCMFNRLVNGIQKQQQLLYNAEIHDRRRQDSSRYSRVSRHRIQEEEEEEDFDQQQSSAAHRHVHSRKGCRESSLNDLSGYNARTTGYNASSSRSSALNQSQAVPIPISSKISCLEENKKSIEGIMYTRHQAMTSLREESLASCPNSYSSYPRYITSSAPYTQEQEEQRDTTHVITDDEHSDYDFGMFEMEI